MISLLCVSAIIYAEKPEPSGQTRFVVLIPSYNNSKWYKRNLDSVFMQTYPHYRVIYIDDCSPDGTGQLVENYIKQTSQEYRFTLIKNEKRIKAMANIYKGVNMCEDDEVVVMLDGDDFLAHERVFDQLNRVYNSQNVWLTFGSFTIFKKESRYVDGWAQNIPRHVVACNAFRYFQPGPSHLRTFYAGLFKQIDIEDLCENGDFYEYTYDLAMMFPMLEMAGERFKFIHDRVYIYNDSNALSDHKENVSKIKQRMTDLRIRAKNRYNRLDYLFEVKKNEL